jgi:hypothetical protein
LADTPTVALSRFKINCCEGIYHYYIADSCSPLFALFGWQEHELAVKLDTFVPQ